MLESRCSGPGSPSRLHEKQSDDLEHQSEKWDPLFGLIRCSIPLAGASVATENRVHFSLRRANPAQAKTALAACRCGGPARIGRDRRPEGGATCPAGCGEASSRMPATVPTR